MKQLAIVIPFRDREAHLKILLPMLTKALDQNAKIFPFTELFQYKIWVIEQSPEKPFNPGKIKNAGFALAENSFDYVCFHDVDMVPIRADYSYTPLPTHLAANVSQFKDWAHKGLAYPSYFGGVVLFNKADFIKVNGYSNEYWGYGAEDDDLLFRVNRSGLKWIRRPGNYESLFHHSSSGSKYHQKNLYRFKRIVEGKEQDLSGLSNLNFSLKEKQEFPNYILYSIDI